MSTTGLIIKREYTTRVKKRSFLITTILGPILLALIYIVPILLALKSDNTHHIIAVVDESHWYENLFTNNDEHTFIRIDNTPIEEVKEMVRNGDFEMVLYIPKTELNAPSNAAIYSDDQIALSIESYIKGVMKKEIEDQKLMASGVDPDIVNNVRTEINLSVIRMDEEGGEKETFSELEFIMGIALATMIYMFILMFGGQVMHGVAEEKTNRIIEVIISSVKPFQLMMGKIIGVSLVALTQFAIWLVLTGTIYIGFSAWMGISSGALGSSGTVMSQNVNVNDIMSNEKVSDIVNIVASIDFGTIILCFIAFFILGYLFYATMFAAVGSLVDNNTDSQQFMLPITVPLIVALISAFYIVNNPSSSFAIWLSMIPFTSPIAMMVRIPFGIPIWQIAVSITILAVSFVAMTWLAAKIYRTGILMYGKKLTYKEVFKWLRHN